MGDFSDEMVFVHFFNAIFSFYVCAQTVFINEIHYKNAGSDVGRVWKSPGGWDGFIGGQLSFIGTEDNLLINLSGVIPNQLNTEPYSLQNPVYKMVQLMV
ncbi:MAG: hypothetical protein R3C26_04605 [Calditrichia bacterium]